MSRQLRIALVLLLVAALAGCGEDEPAPAGNTTAATSASADTRAGAPRTAFAYLTESEFVVRRGEAELGHVEGGFAGIGWTDSGNYAYATSYDTKVITVVDPRGGTNRKIPCGCVDVVPVAGDQLAWVDDAGGVYRADLAGGEPTRVSVRLPAGQFPAALVAAAGPTVLLRAQDAPEPEEDAADERTTDALYTVDLDTGAGTPVHETAFITGASGTGVEVAGKPRFAVSAGHGDGSCDWGAEIWVYDGVDRSPVRVDERVFDPGLSDEWWISVDDWWWNSRGELYATMGVWSCVEGEGERAKPSGLWRLDGTTWRPVRPGPLMAARELDRGGYLTLVPGKEGRGTLSIEANGSSRKIAGDVLRIAASPV